MAGRLLSKSRNALTYGSVVLRGVKPMISQVFSSDAKRGLGSQERYEETSSDEPSTTVWPDPNLGFLGPQDRRLPLPGNVGLGSQLLAQSETEFERQRGVASRVDVPECDVLTCLLPQERQASVLTQVLHTSEANKDREDFVELLATGEYLECVAQDCPQLIRKDFSDLFPGLDVTSGSFTVVTFSMRTIQDLASEDIEQEELMLYFVIAAEEMCSQLKDLGFWADFIDPSSGRPYRSPYTSASVFETDERYRRFGFMIEDLGHCKVATHHAWSPHVFVGCLFTNAPASSSHLKTIVDRHHGRKRVGHVD